MFKSQIMEPQYVFIPLELSFVLKNMFGNIYVLTNDKFDTVKIPFQIFKGHVQILRKQLLSKYSLQQIEDSIKNVNELTCESRLVMKLIYIVSYIGNGGGTKYALRKFYMDHGSDTLV